MIWSLSHRCHPAARAIADRHYNRQHIGAPNFVPPGRCLVLYAPQSLWVSSWPFAEYVRHEWAGAWVNSCFRREGGGVVASDMIRQALAATRWKWENAPSVQFSRTVDLPGGKTKTISGFAAMVTFVERDKVHPKRDYGRCYLKAGFEVIGETKGGLLALGIRPENLPDAEEPIGAQGLLIA